MCTVIIYEINISCAIKCKINNICNHFEKEQNWCVMCVSRNNIHYEYKIKSFIDYTTKF